MLMLNWISSACIVQAGQAGPLYVNTKISMFRTQNMWLSIKTLPLGLKICLASICSELQILANGEIRSDATNITGPSEFFLSARNAGEQFFH